MHEVKRYDIINHLIEKSGFKSYLEIGVQNGVCFRSVKCETKIGVDPNPLTDDTTHRMTSDYFFSINTDKFDVIFIDGLHESKQVAADIAHAVECLNEGGVILCHDMNPLKEEHQTPKPTALTWTGDCWKALVEYRQLWPEKNVFTVNTDWGVAIICDSNVLTEKGRKHKQRRIKDFPAELTYQWFDQNRYDAINLISTIDFYNIF